jgi:sigma-B regulation protein RsbU (phosphoserine phosphatase)
MQTVLNRARAESFTTVEGYSDTIFGRNERRAHLPPVALLPPPKPTPRETIRRFVTSTFAGRMLAVGALSIAVARALAALVGWAWPITLLNRVGVVALLAGALAVLASAFGGVRRRVLWRVRRKLVLSYVFIGLVPALLIVTFFLLCGLIVFFGTSAYIARARMTSLVEHTRSFAEAAALEIQTATGDDARAGVLERLRAGAALRYSSVSYAVIETPGRCGVARISAPSAPEARRPLTAGAWSHTAAPATVPAWLTCEPQAALIAVPARTTADDVGNAPRTLAARAVGWTAGDPSRAVIVDVEVDDAVAAVLRKESGVEVGGVLGVVPAPPPDGSGPRLIDDPDPPAVAVRGGARLPSNADGAGLSQGWLRRPVEWVAFFGLTSWATGEPQVVAVRIRTSLAEVYTRLTSTPTIGDFDFGSVLLIGLAIVAGLFFVIQAVALVVGLGLARSITGAVHALFVGTERISRGDFTHRIAVGSNDQLGQLAESFNSMTASIEHLLVQKAEKDRLAQELAIARTIQMSLLPPGPIISPGLTIAGHCEPAREVGGDYYDVLPLGDHKVGVLIADVAGKGASAALYMAELKGIILSLSQRHTSPRELLIEANHIMSRHLDNRAFITATYLVLDFETRTLRYARAGHCPLIYVPGAYAASREPQVLAPDGLVLGLRIDDGQTFVRLLEEITVPFGAGDVLVLYTDGISEAASPGGDFFGDARLAALVYDHRDLPVGELSAKILAEVSAFTASAVQQDDMTMVLMRVDDGRVAS